MAAEYSHMHDEGIWTTAQSLLREIPGSEAEVNDTKQVATLLMRMGGLGLRSAVRCADAAYWAYWADALHTERNPAVADTVEESLSRDEEPSEDCLVELRRATNETGQGWFLVETELGESS